MKKVLSLFMIIIVCLSLCSCNSRNSIRNQADTAPLLYMTTYANMCEENEARAKAEFDGNVYRYTGTVYEIGDGYCIVTGARYMQVFLAEEDLVKLEQGKTYTFLGVFKHRVLMPDFKNAVLLDE